MADVLSDQRSDGVLILTLNRPDRLNAFDAETITLLGDHLERASEDPTVRCVVLTGAGRGFCAGGDVKDIAARRGAPQEEQQESQSAAIASGAYRVRGMQYRTSYALHTMP